MAWPPENLEQYTAAFKRMRGGDVTRLAQFKDLLAVRHSDIWEVVESTLNTRMLFYDGEITRAKNDTARYLRGEDVKKPSGYSKLVSGWIDEYLRMMPGLIEEAEAAWAKHEVATGQQKIGTGIMYDTSEALLSSNVDSLQKSATDLERITYGK